MIRINEELERGCCLVGADFHVAEMHVSGILGTAFGSTVEDVVLLFPQCPNVNWWIRRVRFLN